ncbi:hypothetical protein PybrP1_000957 [[Pythium] brassicae (nom. inval.)]|nr:hypothetical protein PybrP1_000957 [[Pythium] brassicae (nom. inval.)]
MASLRAWLALYAPSVEEAATAASDFNALQAVLRIACMPLDVNASQLHREDAAGQGARTRLCEFALAAAVQSTQRADFVRDIQSLSDDVQAALVAAIERARVTQELQDATRRLATAATENDALVDAVRALKLELEVDGLRRERAVRALFDERVRALEAALEAANGQAQTHAALAIEAAALRDEVDLLRPAAERAAKTEAAVAKYKARVEELSSVREKLRRIEGANAELIATNLALEVQLAKAAALQRKLVEAKDANTAVEFRASELQAQLARQAAELERSRHECAASQHALLEATALNEQLQRAAGEHAAALALPASALAGGVSEFNPALAQKLARLAFENDALRAQADGAAAERVERLLDEVDDLTRLKQSFEARYFDAEQELQRRRERIERLEEGAARLDALCAEQTAALLRRDADARALEESADRLRVRVEETTALVGELRGFNKALETRVAELTTALAAATADAEDRALQTVAVSLLFSATFEANDELQRALQQCLEREAELTQRNDTYRREVAALQSAHSRSLTRMTDAVSAKAARVEALTAQLRAASEAHAAALAAYAQEHSMSDAAREAVERGLRDRVAQLETELRQRTAVLEATYAQFDAREAALERTVRDQLASNQQLMVANQALKSELRRAAAEAAQLELAATRLESKVLVLENERAHVAAQEDRKREAEDDDASLAAQLAAQVALVVAELEQVQSEHAVLRERLLSSESGAERQPHTAESARTMSYVDRIRQLEQAKHEEASKRRALVLVNTKLLQEQRQAQKKQAAVQREMQLVRDKMNSWRLRDERRRKESDATRRKLEVLEAQHRLLLAERRQLGAAAEAAATALRSPGSDDGTRHRETRAPGASSSVDENLSPNIGAGRKRKLDADGEELAASRTAGREALANDGRRPSSSGSSPMGTAAAAATHQTTTKRRAPRYVLQPDPPTQTRDDDKPSECQHQ